MSSNQAILNGAQIVYLSRNIMMQQEIAKQIAEYLDNYSTEKGYQSIQGSHKDFLRIDISNGLDKININIYHTGKFVVGGVLVV